MPRFFIKEDDTVNNNSVILHGDSAHHISYSLRMRVGDELTLCDFFNYEYHCVIKSISKEEVFLEIISKNVCSCEPAAKVSLYQGVPKSTKFELIIQKCVELGVTEIVPVITSRCISRPDKESFEKKLKRWNAISEEAAKQSGRGIVPRICEPIDYNTALSQMKDSDISFICYEGADTESDNIKSFLSDSLENVSNNKEISISFLVGPEGGISDQEAFLAHEHGVSYVSLGKRILRTETAPICVMSCIMYETGNM